MHGSRQSQFRAHLEIVAADQQLRLAIAISIRHCHGGDLISRYRPEPGGGGQKPQERSRTTM